jgi:enamine deaminase RidA (YjgF/YER057c/UK114 family)
MKVVQPEGWAPAKGYANGVVCEGGRTVYVAGQIGWDAQQRFHSDDFVEQWDQALANVVAVLHAAGAAPEHLVKMTVYVTDLDAYRSNLREVGVRWKKHFGRHFPAMALVGVAGLVEPRAKVEIEAIAHLTERP